jgi:predicted transcriptional regulator
VLHLASAPGGLVQPYGLAALRKVEMANANAVRKALASLEESELIARSPEGWVVADPFFRRWLQTDP